MSEQIKQVLIKIISRIPGDIRIGGEGWAMAGALDRIAAIWPKPVERVCNGHYVTEHEHGSLNNVTVSVAVLLTACGKRQPADSRYCQSCGGRIKIE